MFKRESEQPVRISFEEKREKRKKRSIRERLSSIPVRRRVEAVVLSVVTVMASLSIDWSSLLANAAEGQDYLQSGQSISTIFTPAAEQEVTTLSKAKISVKIPSNSKEVDFTWKVYQNLTDEENPESGVEVEGTGGSGTIEYSNGGFVEKEVTLSDKVVLLGDETAAVVFTLTSKDGYEITYKTFNTTNESRFVINDGDWIEKGDGKCIEYTSTEGGTLANVTLSGVPEKLALTAGAYYNFTDENNISWSPAYQRTLTLTNKNESTLIAQTQYPTFKVADSIGDGGTATITVGGTGIKGVDVPVKVVSFALNGDDETDKSVFTYTGKKFNAADLYTAKCGSDTINVANNFTTTYKGTLINGTSVTEPLNAGSYTMTIKGKAGTDYAGLSITKDFTIAQGTLKQDMFTGASLDSRSEATVRSGVIESITDGTFSDTRKLVYGVDFDAEITGKTPAADKVTYTVKITGKNNFTNGKNTITLTAEESGGVALSSVVDHIKFKTNEGTYDATAKKPEIEFYNSSNQKIENVFTNTGDKPNYSVKYNGVKRSTGAVVTDADEITDAGEYTATVYGLETYAGSSMTTLATATELYVLKPISFTTDNVTVRLKKNSFEYGDALEIEIDDVTYTASNPQRGLAAGTEYKPKVEQYSPQIGSHLVTVEGYGNYEGVATAEYTVFPSLLNSATIGLDDVTDGTLKAEKTAEWDYVWTYNRSYTYTGAAIEPKLTAVVNGESLSVGAGANNMTKGAGVNNTAVTTSGSKAYFILTLPAKYASKKIKVEFEIGAKTLPSGALSILHDPISKDYAYGTAITLDNGIDYYVKDEGTTLTEGTHYTISYENNVNAGKATITATGIGNYSGTSSKTFTINPTSVDDVEISINPQKLDTSGTVVTDMSDVVITVTDGDGNELHPFTSEDFTLFGYKNNLSAWISAADGDQPQATLTGQRNLTGTKVIPFEILKETLSGLTWKLVGTSISGTLGNPGTTVDLTADYGYVVDFVPNLSSKTIKLYYSSGTKFDTGNYTCKVNSVQAGTNTITIFGKKNYDGGEYKFTYEVEKLDITSSDCVFTQTDGDSNTLPTFTLAYNGTALVENTDYTKVVTADKVNDKYEAKDGYTVKFTGINSYTGTRTETFHIGAPFDSDHVFVTMYGPNGTGTVGSENRLTYFGDNDPYFILTSNKTDSSKKIEGPTYAGGAYDTNTGDYIITFEPYDPDERHKVGTTVKVTFTAKEGNGVWYNPGNEGITYSYKVMPGVGASVTGYPNLQTMLWIFTDYSDAKPQEGAKQKFPATVINNLIPFNDFEFPYTTEARDPEIYICYDPVIDSGAYATQCSYGGVPSAPTGDGLYSEPVKVKFNDSSLFTVSRGLISANDEDKKIIMTPVRTGWLGASNNPPKIEVDYTFGKASLSDAKINFTPSSAEYTYSGNAAAVSYSVRLGNSTLTPGTDYELNGYYAYPNSGDAKTAIDAAIADKTKIGEKLTSFGDNLGTTAPTKAGNYVLVIGGVTNGHYEGYNIEKFSIATATFTAALADPDNFSVTYGADKKAPVADDLVVTGANGALSQKASDSADDGYYIDPETANPEPGINSGVVNIKGTGNYKGCTKQVTYKVVADISSSATKDFKDTNLSLTDDHLVGGTKALELRLKNDNGLPFIGDSSNRFDPSTLTLSDGTVTLQSSYLKTTVSGINSSDSLTTVGKKKITIEASNGAPVTGSREYYVEVFADISTAEISLEANGAIVSGTEIAYTGQSILVTPVLRFRGSILDSNSYTIMSNSGSNSYTDVGKYTMSLKGSHTAITNDGKYYIGTATIDFSIVYDLQNGVEIVYQKTEGGAATYVPLAGMSFSYTGSSIGSAIENSIKVRVKGTADTFLNKGQANDYTLSFANDTNPGGNTASATINHTATRSINTQTVYFSIGGSTLTEDNCTITLNPATYEYDGTAKTPTVSVLYTEGSRQLVQDYDFKVTYSNNINVTTDDSKAKVTVTGINGRYVGSVTKTFEITAKELTQDDVNFPDVPFGGSDSNGNLLPATPTITVTSGGKTLTAGKDYEISYPERQADETVAQYFTKNAGTVYKVKITGIGNYSGEVEKTAVQLSGTLNSPNIIIDPSQSMTSVYDGKKVTFGGNGPVIKNGNSTLRYGIDYTITELPEIINAGTYNITITALEGGYYYDNGSQKTFTYTVTPRSVEDNAGAFVITLYDPVTGSSDPASFTWTGSQVTPKVKAEDTGISNHEASVGSIWTNNDALSVSPMMNDFAVSYGSNKDAGAEGGVITLTASGNYTGTITKTFAIGQDIAYASLSYDKTTADYDGTPKSQTITVIYNGKTLTAGTAYESPVVYTWTGGETTAPTNVGSYIPVIKGKPDGGYYGQKQGTAFRIIAQNKTGNIKIKFNGVGGEVDAADYVCHYNTKKQTPSINVYDTSGDTAVALTENVDYTVHYGNNTKAGSGYVYVDLMGNYTGTAQEIFTIQPYDISNATLEFIEGENGIIKNVPEASFPYSPLFRLRGTDDNGEQFVISYADSRQKQDLSIPDSSKVKKPGKGSLAVSGTGNNLYGTTNAYDYEVYGRLSEKNVVVTPPINTGVKKDPEVKVVFAGETLVLDTDYSLRIVPFDQTVSGGGNVIVEGLGYFTGSVYTKYGEASDVSSLTLRGFSQQYIYSGVFAGPQESAIYAVDSEGNTVISADKLECTFTSDKDNASCITANATVTITTKATLEDGTVQDGPKATYKIVPRNINSCDIMRLENDIYTGKALKPPVAVSFRRKEYTFGSTGGITEEKVLDVITLKEGTDYSLSYKNNVYPGTADITVTGKGNYTGTRLFHFVINVISMGSVNARRTSDGIVVSWAARPYVAGYRVLYDTDRLTGVSTTGTTVTLKDALPTRVGVQPYILGSGKTPIYGAVKYIDVS